MVYGVERCGVDADEGLAACEGEGREGCGGGEG